MLYSGTVGVILVKNDTNVRYVIKHIYSLNIQRDTNVSVKCVIGDFLR